MGAGRIHHPLYGQAQRRRMAKSVRLSQTLSPSTEQGRGTVAIEVVRVPDDELERLAERGGIEARIIEELRASSPRAWLTRTPVTSSWPWPMAMTASRKSPKSGRVPRKDRRAAAGGTLAGSTYRRTAQKVGRNDPCPCASGKKFKHCCGKSTLHWWASARRQGCTALALLGPLAFKPARAR